MIKKIIILSRKQVEQIIDSCSSIINTWALISIWDVKELLDPFSREVLFNKNCKNTLSLRFEDLTFNEFVKLNGQDQCFLFNEEHAMKIIDFIDKVNSLDVDELVVHCAAGISRSGAVGLFACQYFKLNESEFRELNKQILPNFHVLEVLNSVSKINKNYVNFWDTKENKKKREKLFNFFIHKDK